MTREVSVGKGRVRTKTLVTFGSTSDRRVSRDPNPVGGCRIDRCAL